MFRTLIKLSSALLIAMGLAGCGEQEDPNKIHTIVLDNGKIQRTLKIPGGYIRTKGKGGRTAYSIWVYFTYPSMQPFYWAASPTEDRIALLIELSDIGIPDRSQVILDDIKGAMNIPPDKYPARYVGKSGIYDLYEEKDINTQSFIKTYFIHDKNGSLISFRDSNLEVIRGVHRHVQVLELQYQFHRSLLHQKLEIDAAVTKFVDSILQK